MISSETPFEWYNMTMFRKKLSFLRVSDDVIKFYNLHQILFFLHFGAIVSHLKLSAHKEQPNDL